MASRPPRPPATRDGRPPRRPSGVTATRVAPPPPAGRRPPPAAPRSPQPTRPTVSPTSADRFAARVRARRRRRALLVVVALLMVVALGWLALRSPWATVSKISVSGTHRIPAAQVRAQAEPELGHPMLLARTEEIAQRLRAEPLVKSVTVSRSWPSGLRITVVERVPVAAVPSGSELALVDDDGVVVEKVAKEPAALPRIEVDVDRAGVEALRGCLAVLAGLPSGVKGQVRTIGASSGDGIWLTLRDGARVEWGDSSATPRKAEVLTALMRQKAKYYDVRAPDAPAIKTP